MSKEIINFERRQKNIKLVKELFENPNQYIVIHYSCESFKKENPTSPRITTIATRNLESGQTDLFSIHQIAERRHIPFEQVKEKYDDLEKEFLDNFYDYLQQKSSYKFIHWNMRDHNYGFQAIAHRYKILGGKKDTNISDDRKIDLSRILVGIYGVKYMGHPRLYNLIKYNEITDKDLLSGEEEAKAFDEGNYLALQQSTLRKVDCMCNILERINDKYLNTKTSWWTIHFSSIRAFIQLIKEHWFYTLLVIIVTVATFFHQIRSVIASFK